MTRYEFPGCHVRRARTVDTFGCCGGEGHHARWCGLTIAGTASRAASYIAARAPTLGRMMNPPALDVPPASYTEQNPPAVFSALGAALVAVLSSLATWGLSLMPTSVPDYVMASLGALALAVAGFLGWAFGKIAQRYTYPAKTVENFLLDHTTRLPS